ncbi:MAG: hypothetical protein IT567_02425 [Alphaproteobacteria bacterium]|nr:hypothetical protein [Alphaproteobacteria bacterium]
MGSTDTPVATEAAFMEAPASVENIEASGADVAMPTPGDDVQAKAAQAHRDAVEKLYNHLREIAADPNTALEALSILGKEYADTVVAVVKDRFEQAKVKTAEELRIVADQMEEKSTEPAAVAADAPAASALTVETVQAAVVKLFQNTPLNALAGVIASPEGLAIALSRATGKEVAKDADVSTLLPQLIQEASQGSAPILTLQQGEVQIMDPLKSQLIAVAGKIFTQGVLDAPANAVDPVAYSQIAAAANTMLALTPQDTVKDGEEVAPVYFDGYTLRGMLPPENNTSLVNYKSFAEYAIGKALLDGHLGLPPEAKVSEAFTKKADEITKLTAEKEAQIEAQLKQEGKLTETKTPAVREGESNPNTPKAEPKKPTFFDKLKHNWLGVVTTTAVGVAAVLIPFFGEKGKKDSIADKLSETIFEEGVKANTLGKAGLAGLITAVSAAVFGLIGPAPSAEKQR